MAAAWPEAKPDPRIWGHVMVYAPKQPSKPWVGLTDEELKPLCDENHIMFGAYTVDFIQAIEAKLKEKNHG